VDLEAADGGGGDQVGDRGAPSATRAPGEPGEPGWTAPPVVTAPVPGAGGAWLFAIILLGMAAWTASPAVLGTRPPTSMATVVGPADEADRTEVEVLDGPRPGVWVMSEVTAPPGSQIRVDLRGDCECLPYAAAPGPRVDWSGVLLFGGCGLLMAWRADRRARASRVTRAARRLLDDGPGPGTYSLLPVVFARNRLELRFALRDAESNVLGTVPLAVAAAAADLERPIRVHGAPQPGRVIALSTDDGQQGLLPSEPLASLRSARAAQPHPATDAVVDLLGWGAISPAAVIGRTGRVTPSQFGGGRYPAAIVDGVRTSTDRWANAARWQRWVALAALLGAFFVPILLGSSGLVPLLTVVAAVSVSAVFVRMSTRWADEPLAVALVETGLVGSDAQRVARLLLHAGLAGLVDQGPGDSAPSAQ